MPAKKRPTKQRRSGKKGGCGTGQLGDTCFLSKAGSKKKIRGGGWFNGLADQSTAVFPASFVDVPIRSYYPPNTFDKDPYYEAVNSRLTAPFVYGGKRKTGKRKSVKRKSGKRKSSRQKKQMGGNIMPAALTNITGYWPNAFMPLGLPMNATNMVGDITSVGAAGNILSTNQVTNPTSNNSPSIYHANNAPTA